ncbi:Flagellar basal body rod FlgEFG protein C-terminal [Desulfacinum hydrothermale DSM 13146]|uniref:Flagellar hook-associated protein 1 n=1 Tax=Desulfacinum hydrothermale DSM 13146 TaxID=1121390 RepID=A0A1W1X6D2_9BACT|nr:flagellar hook-associated protein FlgK [Desulfacinum hydrothermale]SMC19410.1 Flagellar basal body rod FlgEFG protein C-terminal [Desulfacinum hydrothermale DSM 13146]
MAGLNASLEIAKNALLNTQVQIQTSSHNIANAENPNYTRQKASTVTQGAVRERAGWVGMGARLDHIVQQRDAFLESNLLGSLSSSSYYETMGRILETAETYLSDDGETGLSGSLNAFWNAWNALAQNPDGAAEKATVIEAGKNLASLLNDTAADLDALQGNLKKDLEDSLQPVNTLLEKIRDLNLQIARAEGSGQTANDLRDQRYQAMKELGQYVQFDTEEISGGAINIFLGDRTPLVVGTVYAAELEVQDESAGYAVTIKDTGTVVGQLDTSDAANTLDRLGGSLGGLIASASQVDEWQDKLDDFAGALVSTINGEYSPAPPPPADPNDYLFFTPSGTTASTIAVTDHPLDDPPDPQDVLKWQTDNALSWDGESLSLGTYLNRLTQDVGLAVESAQGQHSFRDSLVTELEAKRQSVSGVSIDEEMVELLKQQQLYQAAAKVVQTTSDMIQTAINMV